MEKQVASKKKVFCKQNIPNMLLVLRMILVPAIVVLMILDVYIGSQTIYHMKSIITKQVYCKISLFMLISACLFVFASFTDFLDGFIARKFNWVSDFGKLWDPIADKVLINSVLICMSWHGMVPIFIPVIMIARDVIVDANKMVAASEGLVIAANIYGKLKTVLQMAAIIFIFFICCNDSNGYNEPAMWWGIQNLLMYAATLMSVTSGFIYFSQISKARKAKKAEEANKEESVEHE